MLGGFGHSPYDHSTESERRRGDSDDSDDSSECPPLHGAATTPQSQYQQQMLSGTPSSIASPSLLDSNTPGSAPFSQNALEKHGGIRTLLARRTSANNSFGISGSPSSLPRDESPLVLIDSEKLQALSKNNPEGSTVTASSNNNTGLLSPSPSVVHSPPPLPPQANSNDSSHGNNNHKSLLRSQVASTLHKTLQLEHKLTLKELESYEKQSAALEMECQRAIAALHAAQVVQRERRRELDLAIMERSAVVAVAKHLRERLDGLRKRMWDGEDVKRRVSVATPPHSSGFGSNSSRGNLGSLMSGDLFEDDMDLFGPSTLGQQHFNLQHQQQNSGLHSLMNTRRHSSPGYAFGFSTESGMGGSANTSLDENDLASADQDDVKNLADEINDASALDEFTYLNLSDTAAALADEDANNRADSMSNLDQVLAAAATADNGPMPSFIPTAQQQSGGSSATFTFPAVTITRLHSSGPLSTPNKVSELSSYRRASLGVNLQTVGGVQLVGGNPLSPQAAADVSLAARIDSARLDSLPLGSSVACVSYQRGQCLGTGSEGCKAQHACVRCGGGHPVILCKKDRNVCVKWNMEECNTGCYREHRCLRCASKHHTLRVCPIRPLGGSEFCFAWNSAGTCRIMDCRRLHECIRCGASHPSIICPENLDNYLAEYIAKRRSEGVADDDLLRLELQLTHSLPSSSTSSGTAGGTVSMSNSGALSTATTPNLSNGSLLPPLPYTTSSLYSHGGIGMSVGPPPMQGQQQQALGMRGGDHPMHIAAAAAAMRVVAGGAGSAGSTGGRDPYMPQQLMMGQSVYSTGYGGYEGKKKNSLSGPSSMSIYDGSSLLTETERSGICRDYNNLKCDADENRCRFRHVCLRCGAASHRERFCPLSEFAL